MHTRTMAEPEDSMRDRSLVRAREQRSVRPRSISPVWRLNREQSGENCGPSQDGEADRQHDLWGPDERPIAVKR